MKRASSLVWVVVCALFLAPVAVQAQDDRASLDEQWARIADQVPGFAGYYLDAAGTYQVRLVESQIKARGEAAEELLEAFGPKRQVVPAQYDFRELFNWRQAAMEVLAARGTEAIFVDIDEVQNRIVIGVDRGAPRSALARIEAELGRRGVPRQAVVVEPVEPPVREVLLTDRVNPSPAGVEVGIGGGSCTLGANVKRGTDTGFITASHCASTTGSSVTQPSGGSRVGAVAAFGSATTAGCPAGETCKWADALFVKYDTLAYAEMGKVARTAGANQFTITSRSTIKGVLSLPAVGTAIRKVGRTTGETRSTLRRTCVDLKYPGDRFYYFCLNAVDGLSGAYSAPGDSGAPTFIDLGNGEVNLTGIHSGGNSSEKYYSPWQNVVKDFGTLSLF